MAEKPKSSNSNVNKELEQAEKQFEQFEEQIKEMTLDRMNSAPVAESESKLSQAELNRAKEVYLKPKRTIGSQEKFNEKFRDDYNYSSQYVCFVAENKEIIGETIDLWVKPFAGIPAEEWEVPVNKPVWAPRYVAERIKSCTYHRFSMQDKPTSADGNATYYGSMVVDNTVQRLDAHPHNKKKSIFMGSEAF